MGIAKQVTSDKITMITSSADMKLNINRPSYTGADNTLRSK